MLWIDLLPFETKNCATREHAQPGNARQHVDDAFRNSVREILRAEIICRTLHRQNGKRIDRLFLRFRWITKPVAVFRPRLLDRYLYDFRNETISSPRHCFDEPGMLLVLTKRLPQHRHADRD